MLEENLHLPRPTYERFLSGDSEGLVGNILPMAAREKISPKELIIKRLTPERRYYLFCIAASHLYEEYAEISETERSEAIAIRGSELFDLTKQCFLNSYQSEVQYDETEFMKAASDAARGQLKVKELPPPAVYNCRGSDGIRQKHLHRKRVKR